MSSDRKRSEVWTPANIVTIIRICLVPVFVVVLLAPWNHLISVSDGIKGLIAAGIFILISCTDWIDGYLARSRNEVTDFGKFMDPLADKILVTAALISLVELQVLPAWPVLIILAREFIVSGVRMVAASKGSVIAASWYGKAKTVSQIFAIICFLVKDSFVPEVSPMLFAASWLVMAVALILTVISMMDYLSKARHLLGFGKGKKAKEAAEPAEVKIEDLAAELVGACIKSGVTVASAESLTGGMIGETITTVAGSSAAYAGGVISYTNEVKHCALGVSEESLSEHGPVSEPVACQMAQGARNALGADIAVAVTGLAGPGGALPGKPVGTVWIAVATSEGVSAVCHHFDGDRESVRRQTTSEALKAVLRVM